MTTRLRIFDLDSGQAQTILTHDGIIEAPNWTPDGRALIVNGGGRLYRVALDAPGLDLIDTGFAARCNNDHGISPDGTRLALSDGTRHDASCIYTVPVTGGTPQQITPNVPSWWHGWSPDGATLTYTARRDGVFDIYTIPVEGGTETRLTDGRFAHTDGPDYSADGKWIWFNGLKDGSMDLWRIPSAGGAPERMTMGAEVDWFPHPAPVGEHVLFLSYAPGVTGHPRDHDVRLRLMPEDGGAAVDLLAIFGGQGSINVPCWAPDGQRFAFVDVVPDR